MTSRSSLRFWAPTRVARAGCIIRAASKITGAKWRMEWDPINLTDEAGKADARLKNAQAQVQEIAAAQSLLEAGLMDEDEFIAYAVAQGFLPENRLKGTSEARVAAIKDALHVKRLQMMAGASLAGVDL